MKNQWKRLAIESTAIIGSILLAFAIDAFWVDLLEKDNESRLIQGFESDLVSDAYDLAIARLEIQRRLWVLDLWLTELGDTSARSRLTPDRLQELQAPDLSMINFAGFRRAPQEFDPIEMPLVPFESQPEFDISDDTYREVIATGEMQIIQESVRLALLTYYRVAEDQAGNERRAGQHHERLEEVFSWIDVAIGDPIGFNQLVENSKSDNRIPVELRRAANKMTQQIRYYDRISNELNAFRAILEEAQN